MTAQLDALFDLTVLMDALDEDQGPDAPSKGVLALAANGRIRGYVCASALETLRDLSARARGPNRARQDLQGICSILSVAPVDAGVMDAAMSLGLRYFDDAVALASARRLGIDRLITLNGPDFENPWLRVQTPEEVIESIRHG